MLLEISFPMNYVIIRSHYQDKSSAPEIKGIASPQMCHGDRLRILNLDLRGQGQDKESKGGAQCFLG